MGNLIPSQPLPQPFGRYVLQDLLGEGGFAHVYRAELQGPAGFRKTVAIKIMRDIHPERAREIVHEGRVGGLLKHRNVVDTYELGMVEDQGFVAMEWVDGLSLKALLADRPPPSVVLEIGLGMCRGLAYAHGLQGADGSLGLVHRDLKPGNVLIGWDGSVKVADFGIAQLTGLSVGDLHSSAGTPAFLSPEQACGQPIDARSDVFALGAVLYELATGVRLFSSDPLLAADRVAHIEDTLSRDLAAAETAIPGLGALLADCLAPSLDTRTPNAKAVAERLRALRKAVGTEPTLEMWLAETLGEKETRWVPDVEPWGAGSAEETLDYSGTDEHAFEDALADLDNSTALDNAIAALHRAEQCLHDLSIATRTLLASPLRVSLGRAGLERVVPGSHPYIVFDPNTGGVWSAGARVARFRVGSVMGRLLYSIAVHGASWGRERLYSEVWEKTYRPPSSDAALRMAVSRLRNQLRGSGVGVERIGDGQYALADRPAVVCWREEAVIVDDKPSGSLAALTAPPPTIRTNLGPEPNPFVGRQDALAKLAARFSGDDRLVTVLGPPGTGKTRFIRHFGALQVEAGDSAWFCDLTNARTEDGVLSAVANALGVPLTGAGPDEDALAKRLGAAIAERGRTWVLLDNAEQVAEVVGRWVRMWWARATEARFLITSRVPLHIDVEQRLSLPPLSLPTPGLPVEALKDNEAVALFVTRSLAVRPNFTMGPHNGEDIIAIVRELDGLPLAIELAAARMSLWAVKALRTRLTDRFRLLSRPQAAASRRQATLKGALDWSWELLAPWEQAALAQCSVFRGGFTWEAAEEVIDLSPWPDAAWTVDVVGTLAEHSLLTVSTDVCGESRLSMLVCVAAYGAEKLADSGEAAVRKVERRHGVYYGGFGSDEFIDSLTVHGGVARRARLYLEAKNLVAATERAVAAGWAAEAAPCCASALAVLQRTGPVEKGVALGKAVLAMDLTPHARGPLLRRVGFSTSLLGRMDEALEHYSEALDIQREEGNRRREGVVLENLGILHQERGQMGLALARLNSALDIHREVGNRRLEGIALGNLGILHKQQGRLDDALEHYIRALDIHREVGNRRLEGIMLGNLGNLCMDQGRTEEALEHYNHALDIDREVGNRRGEGNDLGNLGILYKQQGKLDEALEHYTRALVIHQEVGNRRFEGIVLSNLGTLHKQQGRSNEALEHYIRALDIHRESGNRRFEGWTLGELAPLLARLGDAPTARKHLSRGEQILREVNDPYILATLLCNRGQVELLAANRTAARASLAEAEALAANLAAPTTELGQDLQRLRDALADTSE